MAKKIPFGELGINPDYITVQMGKDVRPHLNILPQNSGLLGTPAPIPTWGYNTPPGAYQIENNGAYIVAGNLGPSNSTQGAGAQGAHTPTVDIVVGRGACINQGKGPQEGDIVESNFAADAARVFVSRMTDLDRYFGLAKEGTADAGKLVNRSGVAAKADKVALIGREGVKIVTGPAQGAKFGLSGELNSTCGKIQPHVPKIELIAGNNYDATQGVGLGDATRDSLRQLHDIIQDLLGAVYNFALLQTNWDGVLGVTPLTHHAAGAAPKVMGDITYVMSTLYSTRLNLMLWHFNTLSPWGGEYIVSRNVKTT
tara:strand:+ start:3189 stop:4124 length:936 start_codon:yes stop_codon:yes gene_type:complete